MATIADSRLTLADWAKRLDPNGNIDKTVIPTLAEQNPILDHMPWLECNNGTTHRSTLHGRLPQPSWRVINRGIAATKGSTRQIEDVTASLEDLFELDKDLAALNDNDPDFRWSEAELHLEGMNQAMATALFYEDTSTNPERILGFGPRYSQLSNAQVLNAGGTGSDLTSVWLVVWGKKTAHGIFPKGTIAGLQHDYSTELVTLTDADGNKFRGYEDWFEWKCGLTVRDPRAIVRIANCESAGTANTLTIDLLLQAANKIKHKNIGTPVIYMNETMKTRLDIVSRTDTNVYLVPETVHGRSYLRFQEFTIHVVDAIVDTESALT